MSAIKTFLLPLLLTLVTFSGASPLANADQSLYGHYYWENGPEEKYSKEVDLAVKLEDPAKISISVDISWDPGAQVEVGGTAKTTDISNTPQPDGSIIYVVPFSFSDGFNNTGTGTLTIHGRECAVSFTVTEAKDGRAARQYAVYTLQRQ